MSSIHFYNTLGRSQQEFEALEPGVARIYTCGPTVYGEAHIGNLRTFVFEDLLRRSLELMGYRVIQVMNITDVDDKIIRTATTTGRSIEEVTAPHVESFLNDLDTLRIERAEHYPKATEHIEEMVDLVRRLERKGYAYEADGSVFFRIADDEDYGRLSGVDLAGVRRGERVASDEYGKEDARDFVLWKGAKPDEPCWASPWGNGRPGWHIECSAMSSKYLGDTFDIHCGGVDNIFPHHENEIAQSESASGKPFVRYWLHAEHLIVDGQKMSKSLGNQYTLSELMEKGADPRAIRYLFLSVHYRQKLNFTFEALAAASAALRRLDELRFRLESSIESGPAEPEVGSAAADLLADFGAALADDLNSSAALGALHIFVRRINSLIEARRLGEGDRQRVLVALSRVDEVLAVIDPEPWRSATSADEGPAEADIERLIEARSKARAERDFARADAVRDELAAMGIELEDTAEGTRWKRR